MPSTRKKKPQLRRCSVCKKTGHNKSKCPLFLSSPKKLKGKKNQSIIVYLHEEAPMVRSPHLVNLKSKENPWLAVESFGPEKNISPYQYKETEEKTKTKKIGRVKIQKESFLTLWRAQVESWRDERATAKLMSKMDKPPLFGKKIQTAVIKTKKEEKEKNLPKIFEIQNKKLFSSKNHLLRLTVKTAILILILVVPFQARSYYFSLKDTTGQIASEGTLGFMALQESTAAILQSDWHGAQQSIGDALEKLNNAVEIMEENHQILQKIVSLVPVVSEEVQSRQKLILAGQKIALGNTYLIKGLSEIQTKTENNLTDNIKLLTEHLRAAVPNYQTALDDLGAVDSGVLPLEYQNVFNDFRLLYAALVKDMGSLVDLGQAIQEIFGGNGLRRYLIVFQNQNELRPTGGFLGSFALVDVKDGQVINIDIPAGGSYDLQGQLDTVVEPPTPLLLANDRWEFQDANWFPDFPASSEKMLWFYRHARQITADGVISINATVLERLLSVFGPMADVERSVELTSSTAISLIQQIVEEGPEKEANKPKQIIADLAPRFLQYFYNITPDKIMPLMTNLTEALEKKEIQAYFEDDYAQNTVATFGWSGEILKTNPNQDFLAVINTNIQGEKTDAKIQQKIEHQVAVEEDGTIIDTVFVTRQHTGTSGENLYGKPNIDYLRLYVPLGSELINAGGFTWPDEKGFRAPENGAKTDVFLLAQEKEIGYDKLTGTRITEEYGKTVFGNWLIVSPGETRTVQFSYRLPYKITISNGKNDSILKNLVNEDYLTSRYQLVAQKQSGIDSGFESQIIYPAGWRPIWSEGQDVTLHANGISIEPGRLNKDSIWSLLMKKEIN